jgi:pectate lyase
MRVTAHHNFFDRISLRGPQFLYGWLHYFNNYQHHWYEYGAGSLAGAQMVSEANIYEAREQCSVADYFADLCADPNPCGDNDFVVSKAALVTEWDGNGAGNTLSIGDLALNDAELTIDPAPDMFDPHEHYAYTADVATEALAAEIAAHAGPRTTYCQ